MTHTPAESSAWPRAGASDRPSASGEQYGRREGASDAGPAVGAGTPPFPEARRHEGDDPHANDYRQWRSEQERRLDADDRAFRQARFRSDFEGWRRARGERGR